MSIGATILHADLDAFYASVEQRDDPRLRGRPVIVGGGVVLAASYEAKAHGIRTAMGGASARRLCPQAIVVRPRFAAYSEASRDVYRVFADTAPVVEGLSIDEAFLDVRGMERIAGTPIEIARRLRRAVRERVGLPITVGVARTKFLAKVASGVAKPDGLLVVPPDGELAFLHPLPVERLWGVGDVTAAKLHERGIVTVGEVARMDEAALVDLLGARLGPASARAGAQPRPAAGAGAPPARLDRIAVRARPAAALARRDRRDARRARRPRHSADARRPPGRPHRRPAPALRRLLARHPVAHAVACHRRDRRSSSSRRAGCSPPRCRPIERRGLTLVGVAVANLADERPAQLTLPFDRHSGGALDAALDEVRDRYGAGAVTRAVLLGRDAGDDGAAASRLRRTPAVIRASARAGCAWSPACVPELPRRRAQALEAVGGDEPFSSSVSIGCINLTSLRSQVSSDRECSGEIS